MQALPLLERFDTFGDHLQIQSACHGDVEVATHFLHGGGENSIEFCALTHDLDDDLQGSAIAFLQQKLAMFEFEVTPGDG